jgi:hypothetical protein
MLSDLPYVRALARLGHQLRRDAHDALARLQQEALKTADYTTDVFKSPDTLAINRQCPPKQLRVSGFSGCGGQLVNELTAAGPHGHGGVRLLVRVHSDHERHHFPFV